MDVLLRNALVIDTDPVTAIPGTDVLVSDGRIAAVGKGLTAPNVIDCTDRIVLPGFVDTHRHLWQGLMRSFCADMTLGEYLEKLLWPIQRVLTPDDLEIGNLAGGLECLASGITTVLDYSFSPTFEHAEAAMRGSRASGVRTLYGYGEPVEAPLVLEDVKRAAGLAGGVVELAVAPLGPSFSDMDVVEATWEVAQELGLRVMVHIAGQEKPMSALRERGLLHSGITFVHGNGLPDEELSLVAEAGAGVSIAPALEARMGHGGPMVCRTRGLGVLTGLATDTVTAVAGDMFSVMRATLLSAFLSGGAPHVSPADVLRMATIEGAAAVGMADRIGSLGVGKHADLVVLRANDINLVGAQDPVKAVVTAAHPGNVEKVFVGGVEVRQQEVAGAVRAASASLVARL